MTDNYTRAFTVKRVIDGDTFVAATVDLGYHAAALDVTYRLARVNAPELHAKDPAVNVAAHNAWAYTMVWLQDHAIHSGLYATSTKTDDWRRYLAEITCGQSHNLSDDLLASGNAVPYKKE